MYLYTKNITKPLSNASVAVDDDPEEAAGGETVGRARRGLEQVLEQVEQALEQAPGRVSEEFATVLEEFESAVSVPAEETRVYFESADKSADGLGPFFSGMLTDVVEIFETSPYSAVGGGLAW